jgi:hypothetical protein
MAEDQTTMTEVKTMWSETLLETLYVAMEKNKGNNVVIPILKDLKEKGYEKDYLIEKVGKKVGPAAAARLKNLYSGGAKSAAPAAASTSQAAGAQRTSRAAPQKPEGMVSKLKGLFK